MASAALLAACGEVPTAVDPTMATSPAPRSAVQPPYVGQAAPEGGDPFLAGIARLRRDDPEGAVRQFREAWTQRPDDPQVAFYLGRALHLDTKIGEAEEVYRAALALQSDLGEAWLRLSEIQVEQGRFEDALDTLTALEAARGGGPNLDYQKGFLFSKMGRFEEAERLLRRSLASRPTSTDAWYLLGLNAQRQGSDTEAVAAFGEVLRRDPDYADAWFNRGNALARLGRTADAEQALARFALVNEAREREQASAIRLRSLRKGAEMALQAGQTEAAEKQVEEAAAAASGLPWVARLRGEILLASERSDEARAALSQAAALNSTEPAEHVALARAFRQVGDEAAALREEQAARRLLAEGRAP